MRRYIGATLALLLVVGVMELAAAATSQVSIDDNVLAFDPKNVRVKVGDSVRWKQNGSNDPHNVRQDKKLFYSGQPTTAAIDFSVKFSAGTFHYYCEIHGFPSGGMDGNVRVPVRINAAPAGLPFTVRWAPARGIASGNRFDVQFRIGNGKWRNWRRNATARKAVFGRGRKPVCLCSGKRYSFRARSQRGLNDARASSWSPVRSFTP